MSIHLGRVAVFTYPCFILYTSCIPARPMIQDFQQLTARRIEGQCFYCTTNAFAYKTHVQKYCRVRLVLFAGVTPANLQQQHTRTVLRWPAASLQSTNDTHPQPADSCLSFETPQLLSPLCLHSTPWNAGVHAYTHAHPQQRRPPEMCGRQTARNPQDP